MLKQGKTLRESMRCVATYVATVKECIEERILRFPGRWLLTASMSIDIVPEAPTHILSPEFDHKVVDLPLKFRRHLTFTWRLHLVLESIG